ncbi:hypothetical protein B0H10DRAFT_1947602 [Mycena sp. CBHHK59/15]|nr:hypothetical protein B0H10DRAFT_1947602 [Mycena sp. CBHHK59/15]
MPSELCDEQKVSFLGWINAARRSSMTPEHLIATTQLSQWYKFGLTEGNYTHSATANVKVSAVGSSSTVLSTPSLLDLLNDNDVAPQDVDREALEQALFNQPDPYDLAETDRVDNTISSSLETVPRVIRSVPLARVISAGRKKDAGPAEGVVQSQAAEATVEPENQDWDVED